MFATIFNPESPFWRRTGSMADVLGMSALWLILSLPVVTWGAATAALYDAAVRHVRPAAPGGFVRFWSTFRREVKGALLPSLLSALILLLLAAVLNFFAAAVLEGMAGASLVLVAFFVFALLPLGGICWTFPALSRFTASPLGALKVGMQLSLAYLPRTLAIDALFLATAVLGWLFWFPLLFCPCLTAVVWSFLMEPVFRKYMPAPEEPDGPEEDAP